MITKEDVVVAFKNSCVLLEVKTVMKRSMSVAYQNQRNIWEIHNKWLGLIRIEDRINGCFIRLFPILENGFHLKEEVVFNITKYEYEELRKLYFGKFKEDKSYFKRINDMYLKK